MTKEEFDSQKWVSGMKCIFNNNTYNINGVLFNIRQIEISNDEPLDGILALYKDIQIINN